MRVKPVAVGRLRPAFHFLLPCFRGMLGLAAVLLCVTIAQAQTTTATIAVAVSVTGPLEPFGRPSLEGAQLAVEEASAGGQEPRIKLAVYDDTSNEDRGRAIARQIAASDALLVVGPSTTPMTLAVGPIYSELGVVAIGTIVTGDTTTNSPTFFRSAFSTSDGGEALANYLRHVLGGTRAAVIYKDDGYGQPVAAGFKRAAERLGIATTYHSFKTVAEAEAAARNIISNRDPPAIILAMISEAVPVLATLRRLGVRSPILGTNALAGEAFSALFADQPEERHTPGFFTDGLYAATPLLFDSANAETLAFAARYRVRFGREPSYISVQGYEAMRLAIAAVRATEGSGASDLRARREAIHAKLLSFDSPTNAVAGLNGPLWFTPERGRRQALRMGRFHGRLFESAPGQLVPVRSPGANEITTGAVIEVAPDRYARRQQVVYTGIFLNEIPRVDIAQSIFTADFYIWMRFARSGGGSDPTEIDFPDLVRGSFDATRPVAHGDLDDGTTYQLWQVRGDFKNDFNLHHYPADRQTLAIRFFNSHAASDRIVYVLDTRSFSIGGGAASAIPGTETPTGGGARVDESAARPAGENDGAFSGRVAPDAYRNLTQWEPLHTSQRRDNLVTQSALGDPRLVGFERVRELSGYNVTVELRRRVAATLAKTLLPLGLMALIMFASLYFPPALVKEKVTVAITGALSGAVLLASINSQLGNVGYVIAVEYGFYVFFVLCLLCIVGVLAAERFRAAERGAAALVVERSTRYVFLLGLVGTAAAGWFAYWQWWR